MVIVKWQDTCNKRKGGDIIITLSLCQSCFKGHIDQMMLQMFNFVTSSFHVSVALSELEISRLH